MGHKGNMQLRVSSVLSHCRAESGERLWGSSIEAFDIAWSTCDRCRCGSSPTSHCKLSAEHQTITINIQTFHIDPSNFISSLERCLGPHVSAQHDQEECKVNSIKATVLDPVEEWVHNICLKFGREGIDFFSWFAWGRNQKSNSKPKTSC